MSYSVSRDRFRGRVERRVRARRDTECRRRFRGHYYALSASGCTYDHDAPLVEPAHYVYPVIVTPDAGGGDPRENDAYERRSRSGWRASRTMGRDAPWPSIPTLPSRRLPLHIFGAFHFCP